MTISSKWLRNAALRSRNLVVLVSLAAFFMMDVVHVHASGPDYSNSILHPSCNTHGLGIVCRQDATERLEGGINLNTNARDSSNQGSVGYVFFDQPIKMRDLKSGQAASFNTTFTFNISAATSDIGGDGVSFIMFANETYVGQGGGFLGVYENTGREGTPTFSVEFDTYNNNNISPIYNDSSSNHIGVDAGSITSLVTRNAADAGITLNGGHPIRAWIDYDSSRINLEVRIAQDSNQKPSIPFLTYNLNLSTYVDEYMYVGIGASTGVNVEYHYLMNWNFTSYGLPNPKPSSQSLIIGLSVGIASAAVLLLVGYIWWTLYRRKLERALDRDFEAQLPLEDMPLRFSYKQLSVATSGFSVHSQLGEGGSSSVYRGTIASTGTPVAVKKVHVVKNRTEGEKLFVAEISVISRLRHRNLVKLLGWCRDRGNYLLVYELMPNGSLDKVLFEDDSDNNSVLSWEHRSAIVRGVAAALAYLHDGYAQQVIHRDIKSSNVMLDEKFNPKVGDFGLARLIDHSKNLETMHVAGTQGYIAPEAVYRGVTTDKTDVYAFGTLALEIACGRLPIANDGPIEETVLVEWVWRCYAEGDILRAADRRLMITTEGGGDSDFQPGEKEEIAKIQLMGLLCCHPNPDDRPSMRDVELFLAGRVPLPSVPRRKPRLHFSGIVAVGDVDEEL